MQISIIAAMTRSGVIGYQNKLPWSIKSELQYFRRMTVGKPIIMGRKTFASLNHKPLPERINIILTEDLQFEAKGCLIAHSAEEASQLAGECEEMMIIGGRQIYALFLPLATRLYLSIIEGEYPGDTFFPDISDEWSVISEQPMEGFVARVLER